MPTPAACAVRRVAVRIARRPVLPRNRRVPAQTLRATETTKGPRMTPRSLLVRLGYPRFTEVVGGADGTRTRGLRRDRPAL